jgi:type I restriction enzyme M protein
VIHEFSESLLAHYQSRPLLDAYAVYQHLMDYWAETMQDDAYLISADGWKAEPGRILETDKKGKTKDKGWACDLVPKELVVNRYFAKERDALQGLEGELERLNAELSELEEEQGGEEGAFAELDKINAAGVKARLKELKADREGSDCRADEGKLLRQWLGLYEKAADLKKQIKAAEQELDDLAYAQYARLDLAAIQSLVVDDKWMGWLENALQSETDRISQSLTQRVKELAERYQAPLPELTEQVVELESKVMGHLAKMGVAP